MGGPQPEERVLTGVEGLDAMLDGGLLRGSTTLVKGAPGTGKTCLGLEFLSTGAQREGEAGAFITFEHFPHKLHRDAESIGIPLAELEKEGMLRTVFTSPDVFISQVRQPDGLLDRMVREMGLRRIVIDSITHLERISGDPLRLREIAYAFVNGLMRHELTSIITQEEPEILGTSAMAAEFGISYLVDTVIQLSYVEMDSSISRALLILKQRASGHDKAIRQFRITDRGMRVERPFEDREGVLSGTPVRREMEAFMEAFGKRETGRKKGG
jgi:circadian clock protein KaiC